MATAAPLTVYVKADLNDATKLGDCPFCHRVLLTLQQKNIPYKQELIDFYNKPEWLIQVNQGKVPVIKEGDADYVPDSDVIVKHLEEKFPQPSMVAQAPPQLGAKLFPAFRGALMGPSPEEQAAKAAELQAELQALDDYLAARAEQGPFFGGKSLDATDAAVAPKLYHATVALGHFKGWQLPSEFKALHKYLEEIQKLPAWQATDYGKESILAGWKRHMNMAH